MLISSIASREAGHLPQRRFAKEFSSSITNLHRLELQHTLVAHAGCVNTVAFNDTGDILLSGSDDRTVILWDWRHRRRLLCFETGHTSNVFQARALHGTDTNTIVTCARDGQVRLVSIHPSGTAISTTRLAIHRSAAHKIALDPHTPSCFFSCGEDADVIHYDVRDPRHVTWRMTCRLPSTVGAPTVRRGTLSCDLTVCIHHRPDPRSSTASTATRCARSSLG